MHKHIITVFMGHIDSKQTAMVQHAGVGTIKGIMGTVTESFTDISNK